MVHKVKNPTRGQRANTNKAKLNKKVNKVKRVNKKKNK